MKYRIFFFSVFLSIVIGLVAGIYNYPLFTAIVFYITFFFLVIFSYRIYLIFEKLGVFLYDSYFKKIYQEFKKTKEKIQE